MLKKYKHIFFDLDNTLWDFELNAREALQSTFHQFNLDDRVADFTCFHEIYSGHNERLWGLYRNNGITKQELIRQRFQHTFNEFALADTDPLEFNEVFLKLMPLQKVLVPGAIEVLDYLIRKNYSLYIITNGFREVQERKLELSGIRHYFKRIIISEDIKAQKPSPEIFEYALKSNNARKRESIMVGDSPEVDIAGARNAGIDQIYFAPASSGLTFEPDLLTGKRQLTRTFIISELIEILNIL